MRNRSVVVGACLMLLVLVTTSCSKDPEIAKRAYFESGNRYFQQQKYREAAVEYRNAIKLDSKYGEARLKLAESYLQIGDASNGVREYVRAADLLPANPDAQIGAGNLLLLAGRFEDAKARATTALAHAPANVAAQILLGNALAGLKDFDGAIKEVEEALTLDPDRVTTYASLGTLQLARGNREAAEATFRRAVDKQPTSIPARLALANFYWAVGNLAEAERLFRAAAADAPQDARVNRALANFLVSTKRVAEAERYLVALTRVDSSSGPRLLLADYYTALGRESEAMPLLNSIGGNGSDHMLAQIRLAAIELRAKRLDAAERAIDGVLAANSSETDALLLKASVLLARNNVADASRHIRTAVETNPRSARAQFALGKLALLQRRPDDARKAFADTLSLNPRAADAQTELARLHLAQGAIDTGVDLAGQAVKNDPSSIDARIVLARAFAAKQDLSRAQQILGELVATAPDSAVARTQLAVVLALRGDRAGAARLFDEALAIDPNYLDATAGLISLDLLERRAPAARERATARVARTPTDSDALLLAGKTYAAIGDPVAAEASMRKAIEADPANLPAYEALGRLFVKANRLQDAITEFESLAARQPQPVAALTMIGMIQESLKRTDDARRTYERAIEFDPNAAVAGNNLAWIYVNAGGNLDVALQLAKNAKSTLPRQAEVADTLGWIYYKKGLWSLAIRELKDAVDREPSNPLFHYHLGLAYAANGSKDQAKDSLRTALRLRADFDGAQDATRVLATL